MYEQMSLFDLLDETQEKSNYDFVLFAAVSGWFQINSFYYEVMKQSRSSDITSSWLKSNYFYCGWSQLHDPFYDFEIVSVEFAEFKDSIELEYYEHDKLKKVEIKYEDVAKRINEMIKDKSFVQLDYKEGNALVRRESMPKRKNKHDTAAFFVCTGSNVRGYEDRLYEEFEQNKAISEEWLKAEFGVGGWSLPEYNGKKTLSAWWETSKNVRLTYGFGEYEETVSFKKIAKRATELLVRHEFKKMDAREAQYTWL